MGQQQLLLLVLATVIVGLATVAGIEAFDQNQAQASQDALAQKGVEIASSIQSADGKPDQFGGIDLSGSTPATDIVGAIAGLEDEEPNTSGVQINAPGAGDGATCTINDGASGSVSIVCDSPDAPQTVTVTLAPSESDPISTSFN